MAEEILINVNTNSNVDDLTNDFNKLGKSVDESGKQFEDASKSTDNLANKQESLRSQIRKGREELALLTKGSDEYNKKLSEVAQKQATFTRINKELKASQATLATTMTNINSTVGGLAGGFSVATGAMQLFGIESDSSMKALLKMQALMSITSGLQSMNSGLRAFQGLKLTFAPLFGGLNNQMDDVKNKAEETSKSISNSLTGGAAAGAGTSIARELEKIPTVVEKGKMSLFEFDKLVETVKNNQKGRSIIDNAFGDLSYGDQRLVKIKELNGKISQANDLLNKDISDSRRKFVENFKKSTEENLASVSSEGFILEKNKKATEELTKSKNALGETIGSNAKKILSQIATMGAWALAIFAVTWAIQKLIDKINEIPKELEVRLKLEDETFKNMGDKLSKARQLQNDLNLAYLKNDKERINFLLEYGKKEGILHQTQINNIKELHKVRTSDLQEYLKEAEATEFNLARIREGSLLNYENKKLEAQRELVKKQLKDELKSSGDYSDKTISVMIKSLESGNRLIGVGYSLGSKYNDLNEQIIENNKKIEVLKKIRFKDAYTIKPETKQTSGANAGGVTSSFVAKPTELKPFGGYESSNLPTTEQLKTYNKEQKALMQSNMNDAVGYGEILGTTLKSSRITYLENLEKIAKARQSDLFDEREDIQKKIDLQTKNNAFQKTLLNGYLEGVTENYNSKKEIDLKYVSDLNKINSEINKLEIQKNKISKSLKKNATDDEKNANAIQLTNIQKQIDLKKSAFESENVAYLANLEELKRLDTSRKDLEKQIEENAKQGADTEALKSKLQQINSSIVENTKSTADIVRDIWLENLGEIEKGVGALGTVFQGLGQISQNGMQIIDNNFAHKKNLMELDTNYAYANSDQQAQMMYKLEKEKYELMKVEFEKKKAFDIGIVSIDALKNQLGIVRNFISNGGVTSIPAWASLAVETVMNIATTASSISEISSRKLDQPIPPKMGGAGGGGMNVALTPNQTSLTSKEENLNMMNKSNLDKMPQPVVKVSDIDKAQNTVKVQDNNSKY